MRYNHNRFLLFLDRLSRHESKHVFLDRFAESHCRERARRAQLARTAFIIRLTNYDEK